MSLIQSTKRPSSGSVGGRSRSASTGRDKKSDLRARYWAFLFQNLQQAVDELYRTCETDENISECKEVILVLENYTREFHNLAEWFRVKWEYENTPPPERPNSLAWEIRKSSPGKVFRKSCQPKPGSAACRGLIFELDRASKGVTESGNVLPLKLNLSTTSIINERVPENGVESYPSTADALLHPVDLKPVHSKPRSIDCGCQTENDSLAIKKTVSVGRKIATASVSSFPKKVISRNLSIPMVPEKSTPVSTPSSRRLSGCTSPRKPVPGRNVAAPEFKPAKRYNLPSKSEESRIAGATENANKVKISRSQSDSVFETANFLLKRKPNEKPYASVECVKYVGKDEPGPRSPTVKKMQVITEHQAIVTESALEEQKTISDGTKLEEKNSLVVKRVPAPEKAGNETVTAPETTAVVESQISGPTTQLINSEVVSPMAASTTVDLQPVEVALVSSTSATATRTTLSASIVASPTARTASVFANSTATPSCIPVPTVEGVLSSASSVTSSRKGESPCPDRCAAATSEANKKQEVRKIPFKNSAISRFSERHYDSRSHSSNTAKRKANSAVPAGLATPRDPNSNYVKKVGVPKTFGEAKSERRPNCDGSLANAVLPPAPSALSSDSKLSKSTTTAPPNYSTAIKGNSKEIDNTRCNGQEQPQQRPYPIFVRSKTSIDMKTASAVAKPATPKTCSEDRDLPPRTRRSSKDTDGWETVISRSRRSIPNSLNAKDKCKAFDMNRRFYEPSPSTSLPSLAIAVGKEKSPDSTKSEKSKNRHHNNSNEGNSVERGVHTRGDYNYKLNKERPIISSAALFTTIPSKRKKSNEKDSKKAKPRENKRKSSKESEKQTREEDLLNEESLRRSKELHEKEMSLQQELDDLQNAADLETDVDSDSTEVDPDIAELCRNNECSTGERRAVLEAKYSNVLSKMTWAEQVEALDKLEELVERDPSGRSLKFAKNFTSLKQFEEFMTRWPGRALELHQKLSLPSRKRVSPDSTILQQEARQAKAKQNRDQLRLDKSAKIKELLNKVAEVKTMQATLTEERRKIYEQKQKRAEENRNLHLKKKQEKAHDEAKKQKEIAFINELEAQNKRHDFYALCQEQEDRIQSILEERQRRREEKAAKDAAVEERRKAIEAEQQEKIEELQEKIKKREERIDTERQEKERERIKMAREKARDREDRLLALQAAQIANAEELQKKIQQKQENSARRHEESIELIRQRAIEIAGTPRLTPYQINKLCSICNVLIDSEVFLLSHIKGLSHSVALKKYREQFEASVKFSECSIITDAPADILNEKKTREKERQKTLRKRCKKIRQRLSGSSEKYLKTMNAEKEPVKKFDTPNRRRILKLVKDIEKLINAQGNGMWPDNAVTMLERSLFEIIRVLEKGNHQDQITFREFDGFLMLSKIYNLALDLPKNMSPYLPLKCFVVASNLYTSACNGNVENSLYVLLSYDIVQILELLLSRLNLIMPNSDDRNGMVVYKADTVADVLMNLCSIIVSNITPLTINSEEQAGQASPDIARRLQDVVSYIVCTGIVDKLAVYCSSVHDKKSADSYFLLHSIQLLTRLVETRRGNITDKEDCTSLMATLKATDLVGAVSMLYAILLHQDSMSPGTMSSMTALHSDVVNVIIATLQFFNRVCELNLEFFQNILGAEGISLQVRHIISYLLKYCVQNDGYRELLHKVIEFIGFFAIHHHDNQMILQSGSTPTVLQQLHSLPFAYFSNPDLVRVLFPTLLACCVDNPQNRVILEQEMSFQLLEDFKNSEQSKDIPLVRLLH